MSESTGFDLLVKEGFGTLGLEVALYIVFIASLVVLYKLHVNPKSVFKFEDFFIKNGKASATPLGHLVALGVGTWYFVYLAHTVKVTEDTAKMYFLGFFVIFSGAKIVEKAVELYFDRRKRQQSIDEDRRTPLTHEKGEDAPDKSE